MGAKLMDVHDLHRKDGVLILGIEYIISHW